LKLPDVEVVAVCNRSHESGERVSREFGIPKVLTDWQQLVRHPEVDAVVIGTWPYLHAPVTLAALEANKHVFCVNHMAQDLASARAMFQKAQEKPHLKTILVGRDVPADAMIQKLLAEGYVGHLRQVIDYRLSSQYADGDQPLHWRQRTEFSGVNLLGLGVIVEEHLRWFGDFRRVAAHTRVFPRSGPVESIPGRLPDAINVLADLENGATVAYLHSSGVRFPGVSRTEIYGSEGTLVHYPAKNELYGAQVGGQELQRIPVPVEMESRWTVEEDFIALIRENRPPPPHSLSFFAGMKCTEFVEACFLSAHEGRWVDLPLP